MEQEKKVKIDLLQKLLDKTVAAKELGGVSLLWTKDGEEVCYLKSGWQSIERQIPLARDTIFHFYSMSKPITSAAAMLLLQDGRIDLYDPVSKYIPSFEHQMVQTVNQPVPCTTPMTIRDLLNMTSGLVYPGGRTQAETDTAAVFQELFDRLDSDHPMTTSEFADKMGHCTLQFVPGTKWQYGTGADIMGAVIERVAGCTYGEFLRQNLFEPLGMHDTAFYVPDEKRSRLASTYIYHSPVKEVSIGKAESGNFGQHVSQDSKTGEAWLELYTGNNLGVRNDGKYNPCEFGGAGIFSTVDDYNKFAQMLLNGGTSRDGIQILRPGTVRFMTTHQLEPCQQEGFDTWIGQQGRSYGNFLRVMQDARKSGLIAHNGEYGWDGWLGTYIDNDPEANQTILLMTQRFDYGTNTVTREVHNIINS